VARSERKRSEFSSSLNIALTPVTSTVPESGIPEECFGKPSAIAFVYCPKVTALGKIPSERKSPNNLTVSTLLSLPALPHATIRLLKEHNNHYRNGLKLRYNKHQFIFDGKLKLTIYMPPRRE